MQGYKEENKAKPWMSPRGAMPICSSRFAIKWLPPQWNFHWSSPAKMPKFLKWQPPNTFNKWPILLLRFLTWWLATTTCLAIFFPLKSMVWFKLNVHTQSAVPSFRPQLAACDWAGRPEEKVWRIERKGAKIFFFTFCTIHSLARRVHTKSHCKWNRTCLAVEPKEEEERMGIEDEIFDQTNHYDHK